MFYSPKNQIYDENNDQWQPGEKQFECFCLWECELLSFTLRRKYRGTLRDKVISYLISLRSNASSLELPDRRSAWYLLQPRWSAGGRRPVSDGRETMCDLVVIGLTWHLGPLTCQQKSCCRSVYTIGTHTLCLPVHTQTHTHTSWACSSLEVLPSYRRAAVKSVSNSVWAHSCFYLLIMANMIF